MNIYFDFGSNSLKTVVYEFNSEIITILEELYFPNRLSSFEDEQKYISNDRVDLTIGYIHKILNKYNSDTVTATGTEVFRAAENSRQVVKRIQKETGIAIEVLSSESEADVIYEVNSRIRKTDDFLLVDSGGMSTELVAKDCFQSVNLGAVNLTSRFGLDKQVGRSVQNNAILHVLEKIDIGKLFGRYSSLILTGGSAGIMNSVTGSPDLSLLQLNDFLKSYSILSPEQRKQYKGIPEDRADIILGGALIIKAIMKVTGIMDSDISNLGLRHGMLHRIHPDAVKIVENNTGKSYDFR